ncbi:MAG: glucans biosynthesis glucosyltransferase MdoH [Geminicoccaceae bacterium]
MARTMDTTVTPINQPPVPPPAPMAMPAQDLRRVPERRFRPQGPRVHLARLVAFGGALALTVLGAEQMGKVFDPAHVSALQTTLSVLFTLTFGWIAFSAAAAVAGVLAAPPPRQPGTTPLGRTAIVMPVYNEDPVATAGALAAMGEGLAELGHGQDFEIFILSDTRDAAHWVRETAVFAALRQRLDGRIAVWYRRRARNTARKSGNLQDFIERWGGRYDHMLSLDADSLMAPETIVEMARRMAAEPRLGLLQTVPVLAGGDTLYARLQQFAGRLHGPAVARGTAAWQGEDGNYWGHNAMLRTTAFAQSAGLPELRGRAPFGGHVLSHDFVEAALLRRAGWIVRMDTDLDGSFEGAPPSLSAAAARDRRWAQGNLQHLKVIGTRGLRWPSRMHFLIGVGSYLASPLWLAMILVGLVLTAQAIFTQPEYFPNTYQLFPEWPRFDALRMRWLFILSIALLLLPKFVGLARALVHRPTRERFGGAQRLIPGAIVEIVLSALYAPVMMLMQTRQLFEILAGRDSGWSAQARNGSRITWRDALARHWRHALAGVVVAAGLLYTAPTLLPWLAPVLAGLVLAPWLCRVSGDPVLGDRLARLGLLTTPEETLPHPIFRAARTAAADLAPSGAVGLDDFIRLGGLRAAHAATLTEADHVGADPLAVITARAKIEAAATIEQALGWLTEAERQALLTMPALLDGLARQPALLAA